MIARRGRRLLDSYRQNRPSGRRALMRLSATSAFSGALVVGLLMVLMLGVSGCAPVQSPVPVSSAEPVGAAVESTVASPYEGEQPMASPGNLPHPHIVPVAGKSVTAPTTKFSFEGARYSVKPQVDPTVYWGARASTRLLVQPEGQSDAEWTGTYYRAFAEDPAQQPAIDDLCRQLQAIRDRAGLDSDQYLELIAKYVQSIPYDEASFKSGKGRQRFPVETLVEGTGMCGDKSVLLGVLLAHEGYSVALLDFKPESHMAVGLQGPGATFGGTGRLFLETTGPCYVTEVPDTYLGNIKLKSEPAVIALGAGSRTYGSAADVARIIRARESADEAAKALVAHAKGQSLTRSEANAINDKLDVAYKATVSLRSNAVDSKKRPVGTFMDRAKATPWVDRNAWWL